MGESRIVPCLACGALNRVPLAVETGKHPTCGKCKENLATDKVVFDVNSKTLEKAILNSPIPVVVDCWAPWCGPCKTFGPVFEHYARNHPLGALYLKLNTEDETDAAARLNIRSIPTLLLFVNEQEKARQSGALMLPQFKAWLNQHGVESR